MAPKASDTIRRCVTVEVGFEVLYMLSLRPERQTCCLSKMQNSQLPLQHYICLHTAMSQHDNGLNL